MTVATAPTHEMSIEEGARSRRLWYHDIDLADGVRTRFPEDYAVNPVLERIDASNRWHVEQLEAHLGSDLAGRSVLDLGCADGLFSVWAARRNARHVAGIERNRCNADRAQFAVQAAGLDNVDIHWSNIAPDILDGSYDVVLALGLLYHLVDPLGTLDLVRRHCNGQLVITSALDLDNSVDQPLCRLDRYAKGTHGLWSFNVAMMRQMLLTAGFEIATETIRETTGGPHYFAVAKVGHFATHHIFDATIDQEFPINIDRRQAKAIALWRQLSQADGRRVAIFGAGTHTPWLIEQVQGVSELEIVCVLDDRPPASGSVADIRCVRPTEVDADAFDTIVISSWHQSAVLRNRAHELFGETKRILSLDD